MTFHSQEIRDVKREIQPSTVSFFFQALIKTSTQISTDTAGMRALQL